MLRNLILLAAMAMLAACGSVPPTNVHQPMSVRPAVPPERVANNGAIYQAGYSRPLFEDRRARFVGDTLSILISENTNAAIKSSNAAQRSQTMNAAVNDLTRIPGNRLLLGMGVDASSSSKFDAKGSAGNNNTFTGTIAVTVIEVLANGNLLVSGEKQLGIGREQEFIRLSGIVNPANLSSANVVESSKVADARIEYKSAGGIADSEAMGWLARFFLNVLPF